MHVVQGKVVMGIHMYMGLALKNNILVDVTEDYRKMYSASDKTKLVDIQTTVEITRRRIWRHGDLQILSDGARSPRLVLLKGTTYKTPHLDVAPVV
jgi:hypothetical protein